MLASASDDDTVRLWAPDGTPRGELTGHAASVTALAWSPDGTVLASASHDTTVRLLRGETEVSELLKRLQTIPGLRYLTSAERRRAGLPIDG
jgi:WD40 repeat protein